MENLLVKEYEVTDKDPFIMDHRVNDVPIMPGIVFFNFIAKALNSYDMNMSDILFKNIVFVAPVVPQKEGLRIVQIIIDKKNRTIKCKKL
jgi:3-hydroxymyristoyl/3-hydroxydecanoyl-(acyl carrier protein) dehydratase